MIALHFLTIKIKQKLYNLIKKKTHIKRLLKIESSLTKMSDEEEYEVQKIEGKKIVGGAMHYYIKWKGYPRSENTWQPLENLTNVAQLLRKYQAKKNPRIVQRQNDMVPKRSPERLRSSLIGGVTVSSTKKIQTKLPYPKEDSLVANQVRLPKESQTKVLVESQNEKVVQPEEELNDPPVFSIQKTISAEQPSGCQTPPKAPIFDLDKSEEDQIFNRPFQGSVTSKECNISQDKSLLPPSPIISKPFLPPNPQVSQQIQGPLQNLKDSQEPKFIQKACQTESAELTHRATQCDPSMDRRYRPSKDGYQADNTQRDGNIDLDKSIQNIEYIRSSRKLGVPPFKIVQVRTRGRLFAVNGLDIHNFKRRGRGRPRKQHSLDSSREHKDSEYFDQETLVEDDFSRAQTAQRQEQQIYLEDETSLQDQQDNNTKHYAQQEPVVQVASYPSALKQADTTQSKPVQAQKVPISIRSPLLKARKSKSFDWVQEVTDVKSTGSSIVARIRDQQNVLHWIEYSLLKNYNPRILCQYLQTKICRV